MDGRADRRTDKRIDGRTVGRSVGRSDGRTKRRLYALPSGSIEISVKVCNLKRRQIS